MRTTKVLAMGYSVRHIVCSGSRAGYEMYAADAFGDVDMKRCVKKYFPVNPLQLQSDVELLKGVIHEMDYVMLGSGFERVTFDFLPPGDRKKILGNTPEKMRNVADKAWLATRLDELGIEHPRTYRGRELTEGTVTVQHLHYPVVAKPAYGGGGTANFFCENEKELLQWAEQLPEFLFQEYIKGKHASVSLISSKRATSSVSLNEQLIGLDSLCAPGPFVYCGNITPFVTRYADTICEIAEELTNELGLIGSNGVDFVVTAEGPFVIEVNPRFQGSLDTVERATDLTLVAAFMSAVIGDSHVERVRAKRYAVKAIVFAKNDGVVVEHFDEGMEAGEIVDIPERGRFVKCGEPIASGIGVGDSRDSAFADAMKHVARIQAGIRYHV
jgi:predicted ATP-grasp superfamily ATP-dependent carboligase